MSANRPTNSFFQEVIHMVVIAYALAFGLLISMLIEYWWVILIAFGVLIVFGLIVAIIFPGSGNYNGTKDSDSNSSDSSQTLSSSNEKGLFYKGSSTSGNVIGTYRNGKIFDGYDSGLNISSIKASYSNGYVYSGSSTGLAGTVIGRYENGRIYKGNSTFSGDHVATYGNGNIYPSNSSYSIIGKYTGDDEGGAAAAIYFMFYK